MDPMPEDSDQSPSRQERIAGGAQALADFLREETNGGRALLVATAVALLWANVAPDAYGSFWDTHVSVGPAWLHLDLSLADWASEGLLAVFFFVAGVEVKRELTVGELSHRRAAMLPIWAAVGGMVVPALVCLAVSGGDAADGGAWAIPVATDIAFALGVLAIAGAILPAGVRVLLLSIAVVDDLLAIALIAALFTSGLEPAWLLGTVVAAAAYWGAFRARIDCAWVLWALAIACWVCMHASGVHATVAGIILGLLTPVRPRPGERHAPGERLEHRLHPVSAGFVVPVFALAAAGLPIAAGIDAPGNAIALGVFAGLLLGKAVGILGGARLAVALRAGALPRGVAWKDVVPIAVLGGIGYTVSLLITRLALDDVSSQEQVSAAILEAAVISSIAGVLLLRRRSRPEGSL
jgi:NhaA family Na+:H+ antiporter